MKVKTILQAAFWLILIYLFATRGKSINTLIDSLGTYALKAVALFQGRDSVKGVTS